MAALWAHSDRERLARWLPDALVLVPIGATEQHGPHLPTGTDALIAGEVTWRAAQQAAGRSTRPLLVTPTLELGASDHHLAFGGTLSLKPATLLAVLADVLGSIATQGGRRAVLVNGHGGNVGVCHAAAADAAVSLGIAVGHLDYWRLAGREDGVFVPGHAGEFETSLMQVLLPAGVGTPPPRSAAPALVAVDDVDVHTTALWASIDGYTDLPEKADEAAGQRRLDHVVEQMAKRFLDLAEAL
ncbi:creatininase family protein [Mumia zhuanghuii]|uniref:Creatininase family protein n=1 Tax=Mumia zhuanghuii TaxID=2585211 RepID=A0A5Q6RK96_9ACTN|nr:creatininase family protein [Mumia zhuanghuii]